MIDKEFEARVRVQPIRRPRRGHAMQMFSGIAYWPSDPHPDDVRIEDIAHHLGMICRFTGAVRKFYCVGEHSVHVSYMVPHSMRLKALLHDSPEAYLNDMNRPVKYDPEMAGYRRLERLNWSVIAPVFGLTLDMPPEIKAADDGICLIERAALMGPPPPGCEWSDVAPHPCASEIQIECWSPQRDVAPHPCASEIQIECWSPQRAESEFLQRFYELTACHYRREL